MVGMGVRERKQFISASPALSRIRLPHASLLHPFVFSGNTGFADKRVGEHSLVRNAKVIWLNIFISVFFRKASSNKAPRASSSSGVEMSKSSV